MEVRTYKAYENIDRFSPVFLFNDTRKKEKYVYVSTNLTLIDGGIPTCIGVCVNSPLKGQIAKVVIAGTVNVRYYGDYPIDVMDVYIVTKYKDNNIRGYVSYLCEDITPFIYDKSHIIKVGTIKVGNDYQNKKLSKEDFSPRLLSMIISIDNKNYDHSSPHHLDLIPCETLSGYTFSLYQIGQDLKNGINASTVIMQEMINSMKENVSKEQLYSKINEYCENLFYNIPVVKEEVASGYVKRLSVTLTSGQPVFDSENELRISSVVDNSSGDPDPNAEPTYALTSIPLVPNPFNKTEFNLGDSIVNSHLYPYIDVTQDINSWVVGSLFLNPVIGMYDLVKTTINGVGFGVRYCPVTDAYNFTVSYFIGLTDEYNKYNSDGIIVRLSWYPNPSLAASIYVIYNHYYTMVNYQNNMNDYDTTISDKNVIITEKTEAVRVKGNQITAAVSVPGNNETVTTLYNEIQVLYNDVEVLYQSMQPTLDLVTNTINLSTAIYDYSVDIKNNSNYAYNVMFYLDEIINAQGVMIQKQINTFNNYDNSTLERSNLLIYKSEADARATNYLN